MENELSGSKVINEFVGLGRKMYSLSSYDSYKAKRINLKPRQQEYFDILFGKKVVRHKMNRIQSVLHNVGTYGLNKISLSCFDDKRCVLADGINTLAYGHKDIVVVY